MSVEARVRGRREMLALKAQGDALRVAADEAAAGVAALRRTLPELQADLEAGSFAGEVAGADSGGGARPIALWLLGMTPLSEVGGQ